MSTKAKKQYFKFKSARGIAMYPKLNRPHTFDKQANKSVEDPEGKYEVVLAVEAAAAKGMIAGILGAIKEQGVVKDVKKIKNIPWKPEIDKETDEETGRTLFKFKQYGQNKDGSTKRIPHADAKGAKMPKGFALSMRNTGSEIKIAGVASYYKQALGDGIQLQIEGVQILKFEEGDGHNPQWEAEEGFSADDYAGDDESSDDDDNDSGSTDF